MGAQVPTTPGAGIDPNYAPLGVPVGAFLAFPSLTVTTTFDDNVRRTSTAKLSDTFFTFSPRVDLRSQWAVHALNFGATADILTYAKHSSENITAYAVGSDGRLDVTNALRVTGLASFSQLYEQRFSPELPTDAVELLPYKQTLADVAVEYQPALLGFELGIRFTRYRYGSVETLSEGEINWQDLNRDIIIPRARASYEFQPGYAAYLEAMYEQREFEFPVDRFGIDRSSTGYRLRAGLTTALTTLVAGEAFVGYLDQRFAEPLEDIRGLDFGAGLAWSVTPLTTVRLSAARIVNDTALFSDVSAIDDQTIALALDHELLRNLILRPNVGYIHSDFRGSSRIDELFDAAFAAEYLLNRYVSFTARYAYQHRNSNVEAAGYSDNLFSIAIRGQL